MAEEMLISPVFVGQKTFSLTPNHASSENSPKAEMC